MTSDFRFGKKYMLASKKLIAEVYEQGKTVKSYPFVATYLPVSFDEENTFKIVISAPKRSYKSAVKRNRIKRICKEAVRLNKGILENHLKANNLQLAIFIVYTAKEELKQATLHKKTQALFHSIIAQIDD